jgi:flavin reductase (DIM6/NTAB) family NADH-FMN oxidoreductase RutF
VKENVKNKIDLGAGVASYPMPVVLVGAIVKGKPNFLAIGFFVNAGYKPPKVAMVLNKAHYTNQGIRENKTFSVCIPSESMVEATDYCGLVSGSRVDKSKVFDVFYGKLKTAPMIAECPVNLECKLDRIVDTGQNHEMFIGEVVSTYTEENYLTDGTVDLRKTKPFVLAPILAARALLHKDLMYYTLGKPKGKAFSVGKNFKTNK